MTYYTITGNGYLNGTFGAGSLGGIGSLTIYEQPYGFDVFYAARAGATGTLVLGQDDMAFNGADGADVTVEDMSGLPNPIFSGEVDIGSSTDGLNPSDGTLKVLDGSTLTINTTTTEDGNGFVYGGYDTLRIGRGAYGTGYVLVQGLGSTIETSGGVPQIEAGIGGTGTLRVEGGGEVRTFDLEFGRNGGSGYLFIDGTNSLVLLSGAYGQYGSAYTGGSGLPEFGRGGGFGSLSVTNGGEFRAENIDGTTDGAVLRFGREFGSEGYGVVDGMNSVINLVQVGPAGDDYGNGGAFLVGDGGVGTLRVQNGASVNVLGDDATFSVSDGRDGLGEQSKVYISNGSSLTVDSQAYGGTPATGYGFYRGSAVLAGRNDNTDGRLYVDDSTLTVQSSTDIAGDYDTGKIELGTFGYGHIGLLNGSVVNSQSFRVGVGATGYDQNGNSQRQFFGYLYDPVNGGSSVVDITTGSKVYANATANTPYKGVRIGVSSGSYGRINVSGDGPSDIDTKLTMSGGAGGIDVGLFGTGRLNLTSGGDSFSFDVDIGRESGSDGRVYVDGEGSVMTLSDAFGAFAGEGSAGLVRAGRESGSYGLIEVTNGGALNISNDAMRAGTLYDFPSLTLGRNYGASGVLIVDGIQNAQPAEVSITMTGASDDLYRVGYTYGAVAEIGRGGNGEAYVRNGGVLTIEGEDSRLFLGGGPILNQQTGYYGYGYLSVTNGGSVVVDGSYIAPPGAPAIAPAYAGAAVLGPYSTAAVTTLGSTPGTGGRLRIDGATSSVDAGTLLLVGAGWDEETDTVTGTGGFGFLELLGFASLTADRIIVGAGSGFDANGFVTGDLEVDGELSLLNGAPAGVLDLTGDLQMNPGSELEFVVDDVSGGTGSSISVTGDADFTLTDITVDLRLNDPSPLPGETFTLANVSGTLAPGARYFEQGGVDLTLEASGSTLTLNVIDLALANSLSGTSGRDEILGGAMDDTIVGLAGDDTIAGDGGSDTLDGGADFDLLRYSNLSSPGIVVDLAGGTVDDGNGGIDTVMGFEGAEGSDGFDLFNGDGTTGASFFGIEGDDGFFGSAAADLFDGGDGFDEVNYEASPGALTIDLNTPTQAGGDAANDELFSIESIIGSGLADSITGRDDDFEAFFGGLGADTATGGAGGDNFNYDANDFGGNRFDDLDGDVITDFGVFDEIQVFGIDFADMSVTGSTVSGDVELDFEETMGGGDSGTLTLQGYTGPFEVEALTGNGVRVFAVDTLGTPNDDNLIGSNAAETIDALAGNDFVEANGGDDTLDGGLGDDQLFGSGGDDAIDGGADNDDIFGGDGANTIQGGTGDDNVDAGPDAEDINGGDDFDFIGYALSDAPVDVDLSSVAAQTGGYAAGDTLSDVEAVGGSAFNDTLTGTGGGNDIQGGPGADMLTGNGDPDAFSDELANFNGDTITDFGFDDLFQFFGYFIEDLTVTATPSGGDTSVTVSDGGNMATFTLSSFLTPGFYGQSFGDEINPVAAYSASFQTATANDDDLTGTDGPDNIDGLAGIDQIRGFRGNDTLTGGDDDDVLAGGPDADSIDGGDGVDIASYADSAFGVFVDLDAPMQFGGDAEGDALSNIENLEGSFNDDELRGNDDGNFFDGLGGGDLVVGRGGFDEVGYFGSDGPIDIDLFGPDQFGGWAEGDRLFSIEAVTGSNDFNDTIGGNDESNALGGVGGSDILFGHGAADSFFGSLAELDGDLIGDFDPFENDEIIVFGLGASGTITPVSGGPLGVGAGSLADPGQTDIVIDDGVGTATVTLDGLFDDGFVLRIDDFGTGIILGLKLTGTSGDDELLGGPTGELLQGFEGFDFIDGGDGGDTIDGGEDFDTVDYFFSEAPVDIDLTRMNQIGGDAAGDEFISIENINGSQGADTIKGDAEDNFLVGNAGADELMGRGGFDQFADRLENWNGDTISDIELGEIIEIFDIDTGALNFSSGTMAPLSMGAGTNVGEPGTTTITIDDGTTFSTITLSGQFPFFRVEDDGFGNVTIVPVEAPSLVVDTSDDVVNDSDGVTSLREALTLANDTPGSDTITFAPAVFEGETADIIHLGGELLITDDVIIDEVGTVGVTISGDTNEDDSLDGEGLTDIAAADAMGELSENVRIFNVAGGYAAEFRGLTLSGGVSAGPGGAIYGQGGSEVIVSGTRIIGNKADTFGGGIDVLGDTLIEDAEISRNLAVDDGGGIGILGGTVALFNSVVADNFAQANGGGIANGGTLTVINSAIFGNGAGATGGGIMHGESDTATIFNSTIADNHAYSGGAGIFARSMSTLGLWQSTVTGNFSENGVGGIYAHATAAVELANSIVLGNTSETGIDEIGSAGPTYSGLNILRIGADTDPGDGVINAPTLGNVFAALTANDPDGAPASGDEFMSGELDVNGGFVASVALAEDLTNVALEAADSAFAIGFVEANLGPNGVDLNGGGGTADSFATVGDFPHDTRGPSFDRDVDADNSGSTPDIGAFEVQTVLVGAPTEGDDVIIGDGMAETIDALGGNDSVDGMGGNDTLLGNSGNDTLIGGLGDDSLTGGVSDKGFGPIEVGFDDFGQNDGWSSQDAFPRLFGDVNGDGNADIFGFGLFGTLISIGNGDGTFQPVQVALNDFSAAEGWSDFDSFPRAVADVNNDGFADVIGFGLFDTLVSLGNGDGTFDPVVVGVNDFSDAQGWNGFDTFPRQVADVNGDGNADIVGFGAFDTLVSLSNGDGTFQPFVIGVNDYSQSQGWSDFDSFPRLMADVNGDNFADIVGFGAFDTLVSLSNGDGTFQAFQVGINDFSQAQGWASQDAFPRALADVNGDGLADIVGFGAATTFAALSRGDGTFAPVQEIVADFSQGQGWTDVDTLPRFLADVDGNGAADILGFTLDGPLVRRATPDFDTLVFEDGFGTDTITDFEAGNAGEKIDLSGVTAITDFADLTGAHLSQSASDAVIDDLSGNTITLSSTLTTDLIDDNFIF